MFGGRLEIIILWLWLKIKPGIYEGAVVGDDIGL